MHLDDAGAEQDRSHHPGNALNPWMRDIQFQAWPPAISQKRRNLNRDLKHATHHDTNSKSFGDISE